MSFFYKDQILHVGSTRAGSGLSSTSLLSFMQKQSGPAYVYDLDQVSEMYECLKLSLGELKHTVHYAMKANANSRLLTHLRHLGAGVDTVSGGEIRQALNAGYVASQIIFSGVGKTKQDLQMAIELGIKQINVESLPELERIIQITGEMKKMAHIAIRVNPDVNPQTHPYITTGFRENKFGLAFSDLPLLIQLCLKNKTQIVLSGLTLHIGSQLQDLSVIYEAIEKSLFLYDELESQGLHLKTLDVGGGIGVDYQSSSLDAEKKLLQAYGQKLNQLLKNRNLEVLLEPGRVLVAKSGLLIGEVQYIKQTQHKNFVILNTGMHHLIRPALYQAQHRVLPLKQQSPVIESVNASDIESATTSQDLLYDVVGPICESSDFLSRDVRIKQIAQGDFIAIADAGAYGYTMASQYNAHALPIEASFINGLQD